LLGTTAQFGSVDVRGGTGGDGTPGGTGGGKVGDNGALLVGANVAPSLGVVDGDPTPFIVEGPKDENPYVSVRTPFIPDLPNVGAEIYGVTDLTLADVVDALGGALPDNDVNGTPLEGSIAALVRLSFLGGQYAKGFSDHFAGFDLLLYVNLGNAFLEQPKATYDRVVLENLLTRGGAENPDFGGDGADVLNALAPGAVWATLIPDAPGNPEDPTLSQLGAFGSVSLEGTLAKSGDALYLGQLVPEPQSLTLAAVGLAGLAAFGGRRRR